MRYADDVQRFVQSIVRDVHEAEDITQNVFAKLITAIEKYEERAVPFAGWLMRVARNAARRIAGALALAAGGGHNAAASDD